MPNTNDPQTLLRLLRAGDERAARQVFDTYVNRLLHLARRRISQHLAGRVDPEDIVQSVFRTFFSRVKAGDFKVEGQDDLGKLLGRITLYKALRQVERHTAGKRDCMLEAGSEAPLNLADLPDLEPSPETVVAFLDHFEHFLTALRPQDRKILEMRLEGYRTQEIADELGISDRHVRRAVEHIRAVAEQEDLLS
ncbi:MAG TPA: sigma-70 family RNA polymerase sigma factor, partial [Gemmataceae bacterium]